MGFDTWQLVEVRDTVARAAHAAGCDRDRVADLVLAVNEVATNAVEHGSGDAHLALWTGPGSRELLCRKPSMMTSTWFSGSNRATTRW